MAAKLSSNGGIQLSAAAPAKVAVNTGKVCHVYIESSSDMAAMRGAEQNATWTVYHIGPAPTFEEIQECLLFHRQGNPGFFSRLKAVCANPATSHQISHQPLENPAANRQTQLRLYS